MLRYGIYGGAFDPIHLGHLLLAETCFRQAKLDRIIFVPTGKSPHRYAKNSFCASADDRFNMLEAAVIGYDEFLISRYEIEQDETSYTIDTLRHFHQTFALTEPRFFLLMGADMFNDLPNWKEPTEICKLATPLVVERAGSPPPYYPGLSGFASPDKIDEMRQLAVAMPQIGISSTSIRQRLARAESVRFMVPRGVEAYIAAHGLYKTQTSGK
jgi:nicotinate-nucleotide adenylyltransferase